jgi:hypothetical protein
VTWCPPKAKKHRPRGFAPWRPQGDAVALLDDVNAVLSSLAAFLPLTIRQIFYRLVATTGYPKTEKAYKRLTNVLNRARRGGLVPWDAIRDDGFHQPGNLGWESAPDVVGAFERTIQSFTMDRQAGQPRRVIVWCEAGGMVPQLQRVCRERSVPVYSSGGFDSVTVKHQLASEFAAMGNVVVFHIGDHDPSGVHVFGSLDGDIRAFLEAMGGSAEFVRLAVTPDQIVEHNLPTSPPKATDRRTFDGDTVQAEALPPDVLAGVVRTAITDAMDPEAFAGALELERVARDRLLSWWNTVPELQP